MVQSHHETFTYKTFSPCKNMNIELGRHVRRTRAKKGMQQHDSEFKYVENTTMHVFWPRVSNEEFLHSRFELIRIHICCMLLLQVCQMLFACYYIFFLNTGEKILSIKMIPKDIIKTISIQFAACSFLVCFLQFSTSSYAVERIYVGDIPTLRTRGTWMSSTQRHLNEQYSEAPKWAVLRGTYSAQAIGCVPALIGVWEICPIGFALLCRICLLYVLFLGLPRGLPVGTYPAFCDENTSVMVGVYIYIYIYIYIYEE